MEKPKFDKFLQHTKKAFEDICEELVSQKFTTAERFVCDNEKYKVAIIIGITGKARGRIHLECELETAAKLALTMNFGEKLDDPKDLYVYMAEFANMICGRAATYINDEFNDRQVWLSTPAIFSGKGLEIITPTIQSQLVYYHGKLGKFHLDVGFEFEGEDKQ